MIQEVSINIKSGRLTHTIHIDTDMENNLPYNLAEAFSEVIRLTSANPNMVIEQLEYKYDFARKCENHSDSKVVDGEIVCPKENCEKANLKPFLPF